MPIESGWVTNWRPPAICFLSIPQDTVDVPECPEAAKWTMLEDVYPYFLYDDTEWARATAVMPSLAEYESLSAREVEASTQATAFL